MNRNESIDTVRATFLSLEAAKGEIKFLLPFKRACPLSCDDGSVPSNRFMPHGLITADQGIATGRSADLFYLNEAPNSEFRGSSEAITQASSPSHSGQTHDASQVHSLSTARNSTDTAKSSSLMNARAKEAFGEYL